MHRGFAYRLILLGKSIRPEYYVGYYVYALAISLLLGSSNVTFSKLVHVFIAITFAGAYAMMWNILGDHESDGLTPHKRYMYVTVKVWGQRAIVLLALTFGVMLILNTLHAVSEGLVVDVKLALTMLGVGLLLGWAYSMQPIRLKTKGLWGVITLFILIFFVQTTYIASFYLNSLRISWLFVIGSSLLWTGSTVIASQLEDVPYDSRAGVTTLAVKRPILSILLMLLFSVIGGFLVVRSLNLPATAGLLLWLSEVVIPLIIELILIKKFFEHMEFEVFRYSSAILWFVTNIGLLIGGITAWKS